MKTRLALVAGIAALLLEAATASAHSRNAKAA